MLVDNNPYVDLDELTKSIEKRLEIKESKPVNIPQKEFFDDLHLESIKSRLYEVEKWINISEYKLEESTKGFFQSFKNLLYKIAIKCIRPLWVAQERYNANIHTILLSTIAYLEEQKTTKRNPSDIK